MKDAKKDSCIIDFLNSEIQKCHELVDLLKERNDKDNLNSAIGFLSALFLVQNFVNDRLQETKTVNQ